MVDNVNITAGSGTAVAADEVADGVLGTVKVQFVKLMDGTLDGTSKAAVGANGLKVDPTAAVATNLGAANATTQRVAIASDQLGTLGQAAKASSVPVAVASDQTWPTGMSSKAFSVAFTTMTRQANQNVHSGGTSISNNSVAGSVTALSATISDTNDDPIILTEILIDSTDTGLAGKKIRAYLYSSDPTASTGVGAGDAVSFSNKKAGYIGSMSGILETGFSDGTVGRLTPTYSDTSPAGAFIVTKPSSGGKTIWVQYQAIDAYTPSANSTTITGTLRGFQSRAA